MQKKIHEIPVLYLNTEVPELEHVGGKHKSNWIDLYVSDVTINDNYAVPKTDEQGRFYVDYNAGDFLHIYFGIAMKLPEGTEAHIAPRGGTFKKYGLIQTNSVGVVDTSYCGDQDEWFAPMYALSSGRVYSLDRLNQFRIMNVMEDASFISTDHLSDESRGGEGSTGR